MMTYAVTRYPIMLSVAGVILLGGVLGLLGWALPLGDNTSHAASHLAVGVPSAILFVLAVAIWPSPRQGRAGSLTRIGLLLGLGLFSMASLAEAVGAFGFDQYRRTSDLTVLHDVGVAVGPIGLLLTLAATIVSVGVAAAARRQAAGSRTTTAAAIVAMLSVAALVVGGLLFGY
jgi:hypothetical protein